MNEPASILVVDDDPTLLAATVQPLRSAGFDVLEASSGAECLQVAKQRRPDLVLVNVDLPDLDGRQVCRDLKADPTLKATMVVLLSGRSDGPDGRVDGLDAGADGYILRPVGNGELLAWVKSFVRICRAEAELRRTRAQLEHRHALTAATSLDGLWEWDAVSDTVQCSDRCAELLGYRGGEVPGSVDFFRSLLHPDDAEAVRAAVERHLADRAPCDLEFRLRTKGGDYRWFRSRGQAQWDAAGRPMGMAGSLQDVTERKKAEADLRQAEMKYRTVADFAYDWAYWIEPEGPFRYMAPSCERITGYMPEEFQRNPSLLRDLVAPEDQPVWDEHRRDCHEGKKPGQLQFRIRRRDGQFAWLEHVCRPVLGEQGEFLGTRASNRDITDRKQAESERNITVELLSRASAVRSLDELLSGITSLLQRWSGCEAVGIRLRDGDDFPYYETRGFSSEFVLAENRLCTADAEGRLLRDKSGDPVLECMCGNILSGRFDPKLPFFTEGGSFWTNGTSELLATTTEAERQGRTRNRCNGEGYESVALMPLQAAGETFGLLQFNDRRKGMFSAARVGLFERLASNIAMAVAQQRAVEALRASEEKLRRQQRSLSEAQRIAHLGSWDWNVVTNELSWSDEVYRIFGLRPQQFGATYHAFLASVHPEDREPVEEGVKRALADPDVRYSIEHRVVRPDVSQRVVHERGHVTFDETGRAVRMIGTVQDVTEQKEAEQKLRAAFEEVQRLKDRLRAENIYLQEEIKSFQDFDEIVGQSEPLKLTLQKIEHVADTDASVLLLGETGTGKELFARAIHDRSPRKDRPLVKVNCAALPSSLIESELFGHVRGAFTGAICDKVGRFKLADGGTLFLDEIGDLDPELQTKLLRVLQEGEFEKIGSSETIKVDVRVIAATNRDLRRAMEEKAFRPDLYYRLAVFPIEAPPLRLRRDDIPLLVWHFISKKRVRLGRTINTIPRKVMNALVEYDWPGNVRELENVIERAMILSPGSDLVLSESFANPPRTRQSDDPPCNLEDVDRAHIAGVLSDCDWKIKGADNAADRLGLKPSTLRYRMKKLGIRRPPTRPR